MTHLEVVRHYQKEAWYHGDVEAYLAWLNEEQRILRGEKLKTA